MRIAKSIVVSLAAAGLVAAPVAAQAAPARESSAVTEGEELVGTSALMIIAALAVAAFLVLVVADEESFDGIDDLPASP